MINVMVVSEFNYIRELLRSALKVQSNVGDVIISCDSDFNAHMNNFSFKYRLAGPDIVLYDLDSLRNEPRWKVERMLDYFLDSQSAKYGMSSIVIVSSAYQLNALRRYVSFIDGYVILKPFTFKQVTQVVNNVWTSNLTR